MRRIHAVCLFSKMHVLLRRVCLYQRQRSRSHLCLTLKHQSRIFIELLLRFQKQVLSPQSCDCNYPSSITFPYARAFPANAHFSSLHKISFPQAKDLSSPGLLRVLVLGKQIVEIRGKNRRETTGFEPVTVWMSSGIAGIRSATTTPSLLFGYERACLALYAALRRRASRGEE